MPVSYKDIIVTPYRSDSTFDPKIEWRGANTTVNTSITMTVYPTSNGTLSFEGSAGQLFSITNDLTGSIFSVNDVSGIPSIDVNADGTVLVAAYGGNVGIGNTAPVDKLSINGTTYLSGNVRFGNSSITVGLQANGSYGTAGQVLASNGTSIYWSTVSGGASLTANNTSTATFFIPMANTTSGSWSNGVVANTKLYFVPSTGTLSATDFNSLSDLNYKTDINQIISPIDTIEKLRGVNFKWTETNKKSIGVIAQEVEKVLPELVNETNGIKQVNYNGFIGILIEAIKELKQEIDQLKDQKL